MITCRALTRRFGEFVAVDQLTFDIPPSAICALMGPNGAGKSTTVKMFTGLLPPTSGTASVAGLNVTSDPLELKRRIGVLPETLGLFDDLTVEEHLHLTGSVYGVGKQETRRRSDQLLRVLDLEHGRDRFASQCSHGMKKKTAFAMALIHNPRVLFLDEPFEALDPVTARTMCTLLKEIARRGATVFFTSHILGMVERVATHFLMIRHGKLAWSAPAGQLDRPLEDVYFDLVDPPAEEELEWLGSPRS